MCRLLGYLGSPILLDYILNKPEHSLIVQSYQPREMTAGLLNADGFGIGWYHPTRETEAFVYKQTMPIWNDINLQQLSRYIESGCVVANVRSATNGQSVDLNNCHPFKYENLLFTHNGFIENFRKSLYKPIRSRLNDEAYLHIQGNTDSEHIFALFLTEWQNGNVPIDVAFYKTIQIIKELADEYQISVSANMILSDGKQLVASRFAHRTSVPSLYWVRDDLQFPQAVMIASEPMFAGNWHTCAENSILIANNDDIQVYEL
ncbi:ergothioneine biosynthesis protein EgtC [Ancylothrix sp. C2]|uniref:ergothioneine biosynthesis protein EgtC n=1 Tax=Ancylothrix sp. D3o TaxID=2953691 RepID=UPI0021BAF17E|nr:ergothioneine biosynthesis protein EgtC [Ancylothrix sp. D3o]MCT7951222.1 ergothioneine biosynthesis protein EgtC [Ancylothrix sp. D3o]